jgi:hypothetical protein
MLMERAHFLLTDPDATAHAVIDFHAAVSVHRGLGELLLLRLRAAGGGHDDIAACVEELAQIDRANRVDIAPGRLADLAALFP